MDPDHANRLRENRVELLKRILTTPVLMGHLIGKKVLCEDHGEEINNEMLNPSRTKKAAALLDILPRRGPCAFSALVEGLVESDQGDIADFLDQGLADKYREESRKARAGAHGSSGDHVNGSGPHCNFDTPIMIFDVKRANKRDIEARNRRYYEMASTPRGRAVIINIEHFLPGSGKANRDGSSTDRTNALNLCEQLGFTVDVWEDLTRQEILDNVAAERVADHHQAANAFMLFILSHGNEGVFYAADGQKVHIDEEVIQQFNGHNCPQLIDNPKMFFIQACRGKRSTKGVVADDGSPPPGGKTNGSTHEKADILEAWATVEGYESYRNTALGSFFIRNLVKVFVQHAHDMHVEDMLTEVNRYVTNEGHPKKQVCQKIGTLNKSIFFFPGL